MKKRQSREYRNQACEAQTELCAGTSLTRCAFTIHFNEHPLRPLTADMNIAITHPLLRRRARSFDDDAQEVAFWKSKAQALRELLDEAHVSLRDFEMSSKELEEEMDKELAQSNKQLEEAIRNNEKLSQDREEWKVSLHHVCGRINQDRSG